MTMTNELIEIQCPVCEEHLEVDPGFAGLICRCFKCGTLMTVPKDASFERPEQVIEKRRPEAPLPVQGAKPRPNDPAELVQWNDSPRPDDDSHGSTPSETVPSEIVDHSHTFTRPSEDDAQRSDEPHGPSYASQVGLDVPSSDTLVYVTASGRTIRMRESRIPKANRRRRALIHGTTLVVLLSMVASIILVIYLAAGIVAEEPKGPQGPIRINQDDQWESVKTNPIYGSEIDFINIRLYDERTIVLMNLSGDVMERNYDDFVLPALSKTLENLPEEMAFQFIVTTSLQNRIYRLPPNLRRLSQEQRQRILEQADEIRPSGTPEPLRAISDALGRQPDHLIYLTGTPFTVSQRFDLERSLQDAGLGRLRFDVLYFGHSPDRSVKDITRAHGGIHHSVSDEKIGQWWDDYEEHQRQQRIKERRRAAEQTEQTE
jgi:hypothetical protein